MSKKNLFFLLFVAIILVCGAVLFFLRMNEDTWLCTNGQWVKHGNPKAEMPTSGCGNTNGVTSTNGNQTVTMTESEAKAIAEKSCIKGGEALGAGAYNEITKTWWFDANLNATQPGCNPACVVSEETKTAEINWRCTGLIAPEEESEVELTSPVEGAEISSPLTITGRAKGTWFFEGTMPVKLLDADGNQITESYVTARDNWMTEDFVDFSGTLIFSAKPGSSATLVVAKDNPSNLPENDKQVEYSVTIAE